MFGADIKPNIEQLILDLDSSVEQDTRREEERKELERRMKKEENKEQEQEGSCSQSN